MQETRFQAAVAALGDPARTTIVLVTRPDPAAIREAARTSGELLALGLDALAAMPDTLRALPQDRIPLRTFDMVGLNALRLVVAETAAAASNEQPDIRPPMPAIPGVDRLADELSTAGTGLIIMMGKGGVGKTTVAAALALGLVQRGHSVHLSTTDPAAHISATLEGAMEGLQVDRIDPKAETQKYIEKIMTQRASDLDADGLALLREDLESPCTEEVAVFQAFSRIVAEARSHFVVLDTAPTGHTLLLMDATGAYHRQMTRDVAPSTQGRIITPLMRLQDAKYSKIILVALPETTPVSEAAALQEDLRRASIEPYAWVINRSLLGTGTHDPVLTARLAGEEAQIRRVQDGLSKRLFLLPWQAVPPVGLESLSKLTRKP